jgi:hypothetical protein
MERQEEEIQRDFRRQTLLLQEVIYRKAKQQELFEFEVYFEWK